jgi:hypothetical protein
VDSDQRLARLAGWLFIGTFATSIVARFFAFEASGVLDEGYVTGAGGDTQVSLGAFFEFFLIVTNLGTAIALLPVLRRYSEVGALGYFGARIVESTFIAVGLPRSSRWCCCGRNLASLVRARSTRRRGRSSRSTNGHS